MASIFASKFYKANPNKINGALNDPNNRGLVMQLTSYLSKEDQDRLKQIVREEEAKEEQAQMKAENIENQMPEDEMGGGGASSPSRSGGGRLGGGAPASFSPSGDSLSDDFMDAEEKLGGEEPTVIDEPDPDADVSSSTKISAATELHEDFNEQTFMDLLNSKDNQDVRRVDFNENEIWAYYLDTTNLNTVMEDAISTVTKKYDFIEFNRLARMANAIVFTFKQA